MDSEQMASTKSNTQNKTKHAEQRDATYIQNKLYYRCMQQQVL